MSATVPCRLMYRCNNPTISETCKTFAAIAFAAPSLWTTVLHACTSPVMEYVVPAMYKLLAVYYAQTRRFKLTASTSIVAGRGVTVFLNVEPFLALEVFSMLSESDV